MYEELYASIPDPDAYLARVGLTRPAQPDLDFLNRLVYAHQQRVIFENLDSCLYRKPVSLEIPRLYEKVVVQHRGGFCFELNALFTQLLRDLGYTAWGCMVRLLRKKDFVPPIRHRGNLVELEGRLYFCDVGYGGPMPPGAVEVADGGRLEAHGEAYWIRRADPYWWSLYRSTHTGEAEEMLRFFTVPQNEVDFMVLSDFCSTSPESIFTQKPFLNRRTGSGSRSILGDTFIRVENHVSTATVMQTQEEFFRILKEEFDLEAPL